MATSVGGIIVDGGNFNWEMEKYKAIFEPSEGYHDWTLEVFGEK